MKKISKTSLLIDSALVANMFYGCAMIEKYQPLMNQQN